MDSSAANPGGPDGHVGRAVAAIMVDNGTNSESETVVDPLGPTAAPTGKDAWGFCSPFSFF